MQLGERSLVLLLCRIEAMTSRDQRERFNSLVSHTPPANGVNRAENRQQNGARPKRESTKLGDYEVSSLI
jgi:hypothetical protein